MPDEDSSPSRPRFAIDVVLSDEAWAGVLPDAARCARRAVTAAFESVTSTLPRASRYTVCVVLADDAFVRGLNACYRGKDQPTNVLSFPVSGHLPADMPERPLGDIVLAYETVSAEAELAARPLAQYAARLLVHGALHLAGFTHDSDNEAEAMEAVETQVLTRLGMRAAFDAEQVAAPSA